jgi:hypothetical protein
LALSGQVTPTDMVYNDVDDEWTTAAGIVGLFAVKPPAPSPKDLEEFPGNSRPSYPTTAIQEAIEDWSLAGAVIGGLIGGVAGLIGGVMGSDSFLGAVGFCLLGLLPGAIVGALSAQAIHGLVKHTNWTGRIAILALALAFLLLSRKGCFDFLAEIRKRPEIGLKK